MCICAVANVIHLLIMNIYDHQGLLHVFVSKIQAHVIVVHLHAHQAQTRATESDLISGRVKALLDAGDDVVIMGDFNTLSPYDMRSPHMFVFLHPISCHNRPRFLVINRQHDEEELVDLFNRKDDKVRACMWC